CDELQQVVPFHIKFKDESWEMQVLNVFIVWFNPNFMTSFTTVIGNTIYFPNRSYIAHYPQSAMRTLAHETVHLLDAEEHGYVRFSLSYLFPQILASGVLLFPFLGFYSLLFLLFLLPFPAPFRAKYEARAYAIDILTSLPSQRHAVMDRIIELFTGWDYYRMFPFKEQTEEQLMHWVHEAEAGRDPALMRVLLVYEMVADQ
ncbi:MAG: hypothetical protein AAFR59_20180, partial [Bacteroidota bacterium]